MKNRLYSAALTAVVLAWSATAALADSAMAPTTARVSFCGTVVKLTESPCIGVRGGAIGPALVEITSARPTPAIGTLIDGSGVPGGVSTCMEGTHLTEVVWKKAAACPLKR